MKVLHFSALLGLLLGPLTVLAIPGPSNADCLECHSDPDLTKKVNGKEVSIAFDTNKLARSLHATNLCVDCHTVYKGIELPHDEIKPKPVDCTACHEKPAKQEAVSLHGQAAAKGDPLAPRCQTCHGGHEIVPVHDAASAVNPIRVPSICAKCHREGTPVQEQRDIPVDRIIENYTESIHGEGLLKKGLTVAASCVSCHTPHHILPHTDPRSSINISNIAATCSSCHAQIETVHRKVIEGELWQKSGHLLPACVDCHQPHKARKVFYENGLADKDCMACHSQQDLKSADGRSMAVDARELAASRHIKTTCAQCHTEVKASKDRACSTIKSKVNCGSCHAEMQKQYAGSRHGQLFAKGEENAPNCVECHGDHGVRGKKDEASPIFALNIPDLCARCHRDGEKAAVRYRGPEKNITGRYKESIHGKGLYKSGLTITATCTDCHTSHGELPADDPSSSVNRTNIVHTCAKCHNGMEKQFAMSIHATAAVGSSTNKLPVCNDCHVAHSMSRTDADHFQLETMDLCGKCHSDIAEHYFETYHGKVSKLGYTKTAKCYDCHGAHDIRSSTDPKSHLSAANALDTCRKCHPSATPKFTSYLTHADHRDREKNPWLFYTFWAMTSLLVGVFAVSGLHTLMWLPKTIEMRRAHRDEFKTQHKGPQFTRFSRFERLSHVTMVVTFIGLTLTGLTLKFCHTPWAVVMSHLFGGFQSAGYIHRLCAFLMFLLYIAHVTDLFVFKRRAKGSLRNLFLGPDSLIFNRRDAQEFVASIRWFLGKGERPKYGRWTYWEKFDYFAVFWGILVIGSTGLILWFPEFFTRVLPGWAINVATIVHSDEALLACGFIFTIHFFNTHLRPEKFPMDTVIFTGRMDIEELKVDKPGEYERLVQSGELEKNMTERLPDVVNRAVRAFAWTALAIGVGTVVWIVYALLSGM